MSADEIFQGADERNMTASDAYEILKLKALGNQISRKFINAY